MTYKDHFVVEVKCRGKILRVQNDSVYLPFGSEYSLYLKNLNSRKAAVKISIDGQDVLDYSSLIIEPNQVSEIEGFLNGTTAKNKFKFIQKTKEIQNYRGDKIDDGIIRVEFAFEKKPELIKNVLHEYHVYHHNQFDWNYGNWFNGNSSGKYASSPINSLRGIVSGPQENTNEVYYSSVDSLGVSSFPLNDEGITVKGSECNQQFVYSSIGDLDPAEVITLKLKGETQQNKIVVRKPITVKTKLKCSTCGRVSKSSFKFCPNCGTFLE